MVAAKPTTKPEFHDMEIITMPGCAPPIGASRRSAAAPTELKLVSTPVAPARPAETYRGGDCYPHVGF